MKEYDVAVVGAGINGLGIALDAAERGLSVALVEKEDFCSGVSAWSGRLVHGGLRYLEHYDVPLVRESLRERELLFKLAPHLVKPRDLIMPFFAHNKRSKLMIRLGMLAYDVLSYDKSVHWHRTLNAGDLKRRFRGIASKGMNGGAVFVDGQVEYAERLCTELAIAAATAGADIFTHSRVTEISTTSAGHVTGVTAEGRDGTQLQISARTVVNAAGPWVDAILGDDPASRTDESPRLIGGSKGSHIIVDPFPGAPKDVIYYESQKDGRLVLVIPWMGRYMIGTTDRLFDGDPDGARAESEEVEYLLNEVNALIPEARLSRDHVLFTCSGVRPLPFAPGVPEWKIPRSHVVYDHGLVGRRGLFSIVGGKLTTYRQLAEDAVDAIVRQIRPKASLRSTTKRLRFPGADTEDFASFRRRFVGSAHYDRDIAERLVNLYGTRARHIDRLIDEDAALAERLHPSASAIAAELILAVRQEYAVTLTDVFARRALLAFEPGHGLESVEKASDILAAELGWSEDERRAQISEYGEWLDHLRIPAL